jgi:predicted methyltransferase
VSQQAFVPAVALLAVAAACNVGPQPRDGSHATTLPIRNSAAEVSNLYARTEVDPSPEVLAVLAQEDRTPQDRALDAGRQSADLLAYLDVRPGMRVAELGSGGGHFTELLARSVGRSGVVYAENPPSLLSRMTFARAWGERLSRPANANVVPVERELDARLPANARGLDLVYLAFFYRDLPSIGVDRRLVVANVLESLRPGGRFVVIDRAPPGRGAAIDPREMHTEESRNARYEIERAGFHFTGEGRFFRASTAPYDWNSVATDRPTPLETQDRFVLAFVK